MRARACAMATAMLLAAGAAGGGESPALGSFGDGALFDEPTLRFARQVDTARLSLLAVQCGGRVAILDTIARDSLARAYGRQTIGRVAPAFAHLELYFNAGAYLDRPVIRLREAALRRFLADYLDEASRRQLASTGRLPPAALVDEPILGLLVHTGRASMDDVRRAGRVPSVRAALGKLSGRGEFRVSLDRLSERYSSFLSVGAFRVAPAGADRWVAADGMDDLGAGPGDREAAAMLPAWWQLGRAWRARDANEVNRLVGQWEAFQFSAAPPRLVRQLERLYNRTGRSTIVWVGFAAAFAAMVAAAAFGRPPHGDSPPGGARRRWFRRLGLSLLGLSTLALLAGFVARWVLSGRAWHLPPVMNMFEAVSGSALLAGALALGVERVRKSNYFALSAALYATAALLFCHFLPLSMGAGIEATHGILNSPVMAAHVAVIILGHALAGMTLVISVIYLAWLALGRAVPGRPSGAGLEAVDRCNLLAAQLAAWTLALGTALGAYWADFAWGRWWGWDRKETWALITTLIYVALLHLRLAVPARRRGLVTAVGCVLGCAAMLFNWTVVNYLLPGKHSYA